MARLGRERMSGATPLVDVPMLALAVVAGSKSSRAGGDGGSACQAPAQCARTRSGIEFPVLSTTITGWRENRGCCHQ